MTDEYRKPRISALRLWLSAIFIGGAALRVIYLLEYSGSPLFSHPVGADVSEYDAWAREILAGRLIWRQVPIHAPLYPYFLSVLYRLTGLNYFAVRLIQTFIGLISGLFLVSVFSEPGAGPPVVDGDCSRDSAEKECPWSRTEWFKLVFFALWAWYPPLIYFQGELLSEALLLPLLCLCIFCISRAETSGRPAPWYTAAGLCSGLAVLTHPLSLFFVFAEFAYIFFHLSRKRDRLASLLVPVCAVLVLVPVAAYNAVVLNEYKPVQSNTGFNFYLGNSGIADGTCCLRPGPAWDRVHDRAGKEAEEAGIGKDTVFLRSSARFISENPGRFIWLLVKKDFFSWNWRELCSGADLAPLRNYTLYMRFHKYFFAFCGSAALAVLLLKVSEPGFLYRGRHFLLLLASFWLAQIIFVASARYRYPASPAYVFLCAVFLTSVLPEAADKRKRSYHVLIAVIVSAMLVILPRPPFDRSREEAESAGILAEAYMRSGRLDKAREHVLEAMRGIEWARNYNILGTIEQRSGRLEEAVDAFRKAMELDPDEADAYMNLAILFSDLGMLRKSAELLTTAYRLEPENPDLIYNIGLNMQMSGKLDKSLSSYGTCLELDPAHRRALNNKGVLHFGRGEFGKAAALFKKALRLDPGNPEIEKNLAAARAELERRRQRNRIGD